MGTLIAGPFAARIFGEFGADVIKVETRTARTARAAATHTQLAPFAPGQLAVVVGAGAQQALHRAQPQDPRARDIARQLALEADVVAENYRLGVLEKWGLGYEQLRALNPATIMVRLSGYGQTGPMKDQPGFGAIGESMGGLRYVSGHRTGRPCGSASPSAIRSPRCMA